LEILDYVLSNFIILTCSFGLAVLFLDAIMSWFIPDAEGSLFNFIRNVADLLAAPARMLLNKTGWLSGLPFDLAPTITMMVLWFIVLIFTFL
jgi:hypothetical protein